MRKDNGDRKKIKGLRYISFSLKGLNLDRFINTLYKKGVPLYDIKKSGNKKLRFTVPESYREKVFAISEELCYNKTALKKTRESGLAAPAVFAAMHIGVILGAAFFLLFSFCFDDRILERNITGSGGAFEREIIKYLDDNGAALNSRFSGVDLKALEKGIYSLGRFSFVSCEKRGNVLYVDSEIAQTRADTLTGNADSLIADCDGIVEELKVYRGTATVKAGDEVKAGDVLAEGVAVVKEATTKVNVIAVAVIKYRDVFDCVLKTDGEEERAVALAEEFCGGQIFDAKAEKEISEEGVAYRVTFFRKRIIYIG